MALRFTATCASLASKCVIFADDSACLMTDNVWNEEK
jgi:hypothetical protein